MIFRLEILLVFLSVVAATAATSGAKQHREQRQRLSKKHQQEYHYKSFSEISNNNSSWIKQRHESDEKSEKGQRQRHNKHALRLLSDLSRDGSRDGGLWPSVFNVALNSSIAVNATCGQNGREEYCKLIDAYPLRIRSSQCGLCDAKSPDQEKRHPITNAIDKSNRWWQSPTISNGAQYEQVTITLDLGQVFEIFYLMIRSGISPRPASWIWEKSLDGIDYTPWQYFATSGHECDRQFSQPGRNGKYVFKADNEVICSTQFGKVLPLENGEIHVSLINGRPGVNASSSEFLEFLRARYIRLRFTRMHSLTKNGVEWLLDDAAMAKRSFYSVKSIRIGGRCACSGHAAYCHHDEELSNLLQCSCKHNTCGVNCEQCCPLYNQHRYLPGNTTHANECEICQCHGHATSCRHNPDLEGLSKNIRGEFSGGGECIDCQHFTEGINCEKCKSGFYRPHGIPADAKYPCIPCDCHLLGAIDTCNSIGGECTCREGFSGPRCDRCSHGYHGENCKKCLCDLRGTMSGGVCESHCQCKLHVEGESCDKCMPGYFSLSSTNPEGCLKCFCSGVASTCHSSTLTINRVFSLDEWVMTDLSQSLIAYPLRDNATGNLYFGLYEMPEVDSVYWVAPPVYCGNLLSSYGSRFLVSISWVIVRGDTSGKPTHGPNIIITSTSGVRIAFGDDVYKNSNTTWEIFLTEVGWYHIPTSVKNIASRLSRTEYRGDPVTRVQFMSVLSNVKNILIRGTFHTDQVETVLESVTLFSGESILSDQSLVEECSCPPGYTGSSCESCDFGYMRIMEENSIKCLPCNCNGHAETCDPDTRQCSQCLHNTVGEQCGECALGFYGNPLAGKRDDCKRCACPLTEATNNFSPTCRSVDVNLIENIVSLDGDTFLKSDNFTEDYICTKCPPGYTGNYCERCDNGFYGTPTNLGEECLPCSCSGGPCHPLTGKCIICLGNTEGWQCEKCKPGYWGTPELGCDLCECYKNGSQSNICDPKTGQCVCEERYTGLKCDECEIGYGNVSLGCPACECNLSGALTDTCNPITGQCFCKIGVESRKCDQCMETYYGFDQNGCRAAILKEERARVLFKTEWRAEHSSTSQWLRRCRGETLFYV
ncbi:laminin subunit alpha-1 [Sergentomyia squamirostris]